jgi:hypothetical protein
MFYSDGQLYTELVKKMNSITSNAFYFKTMFLLHYPILYAIPVHSTSPQ